MCLCLHNDIICKKRKEKKTSLVNEKKKWCFLFFFTCCWNMIFPFRFTNGRISFIQIEFGFFDSFRALLKKCWKKHNENSWILVFVSFVPSLSLSLLGNQFDDNNDNYSFIYRMNNDDHHQWSSMMIIILWLSSSSSSFKGCLAIRLCYVMFGNRKKNF